jgi:hypothetical protein
MGLRRVFSLLDGRPALHHNDTTTQRVFYSPQRTQRSTKRDSVKLEVFLAPLVARPRSALFLI